MNFYNLNDPIVVEDANKLYGRTVQDVMQYLVDRLATLQYKDFGDKDTFQTPYQMFTRGNGDCEDECGYVASVLKLLGIPHTIHIGKVVGYPKYHVWITLPINGDEWLFETTEPIAMPMREVATKYISLQEVEG